jgi:hypothetical protein
MYLRVHYYAELLPYENCRSGMKLTTDYYGPPVEYRSTDSLLHLNYSIRPLMVLVRVCSFNISRLKCTILCGSLAQSSIKTMIHLANGWDSSDISWFYGGIFIAGELATSDVDIMGFSFYPFYDTRATFSNLQSALTSVANSFGKVRDSAPRIPSRAHIITQLIIIAETDWPVSCSGVTESQPSIPISAAGQETWVYSSLMYSPELTIP